MKRLISFVAIAMLSLMLIAPTAHADDLSDMQLARIRNNCVEAQSTLRQLRASDALLRVNRGQLYELISTKLMAPLNSRISLSKLDGVNLMSTSLGYDRTLNDFRSSYKAYDTAISRTIAIECMAHPEDFYQSLVIARNKRTVVHENVLKLQKAIQQYQVEFDTFAGKVES
jgi:hypothetical protein